MGEDGIFYDFGIYFLNTSTPLHIFSGISCYGVYCIYHEIECPRISRNPRININFVPEFRDKKNTTIVGHFGCEDE